MRYLSRLFLLCAISIALFSSPVFATTEICGDGIDNDSSGGDAPCDSSDSDRDGYASNGLGWYGTGAGQTNGAQILVTTITVDVGHNLFPGKIARFYDSVTLGSIDRRVLWSGPTSIQIEGAAVTVTDNLAITVAPQTDCNDSNRQVYPGSGPTTVDATAGKYHSCLITGSYGSETNVSSFAGTGSGSTWFVDDAETDCSGAGTQADPEDYRCLFNTGMSGYHAPAAGDTIVFMCGSYSTTWGSSPTKMGTISGIDGSSSQHLVITTLPGCAWYEAGIGSGVVIDGPGTSSDDVQLFHITSGDYIDFYNLELTTGVSGYNTIGIHYDGGGTGGIVRGNYIHDLHGECGSSNCGGVNAREGQHGVEIDHNRFKDIYELDTGADPNTTYLNENTVDVVTMDTDRFNIHHNVLYSPSAHHGWCIKDKHPVLVSEGAVGAFIQNNVCYGRDDWSGIGAGGHPNLVISNNYLTEVNGGAITIKDLGSTHDEFKNIIVEKNTIEASSGIKLNYNPSADDAAIGNPNLIFRKNVIVSNHGSEYASSGDGGGEYMIGHYGSDAERTATLAGLTIDDNTWFSSTSVGFLASIFGNNTIGGGAGTIYTSWSSFVTALFEVLGNNVNPSMDSDRRTAESNGAASSRGWQDHSETTGGTTTTSATTTTSTTTASTTTATTTTTSATTITTTVTPGGRPGRMRAT